MRFLPASAFHVLTVIGLATVTASSLTAQPPAGLAGSWALDVDRSDPLQRGGAPLPATVMTIELQGNDVGVDRRFQMGGRDERLSFTYVTDGKPHELPALMGMTRKARARWKKQKLLVSYTLSRNTPRGNFDLDVNESWELSKDGGEIQIQYATRMGERSVIRNEYYVRRPAP